MILWRVIIIVCAAIALGFGWGMFCDWMWAETMWRLAPEILGAGLIGFSLARRSRKWWLKPL